MTEKEITLICRAACDLETGNHLLRKRTEEENNMRTELCIVLNLVENGKEAELTPRQKEIYEEYRVCSDYDYAKSKGRA